MKLKVVESNREKRQRTKVEGGGRQGTRGPLGGGGAGGSPKYLQRNRTCKGTIYNNGSIQFLK